MLLVFVIMTKYPINKKVFKKVMDAKEKMDNGIEVDMTEIEKIFK